MCPPPVPPLPERELLRRWEACRPRFVGRLRARGWSEADAEDLFADGLLRAFEKSGELRQPEAAEAWLWRLIHRRSLDERRRMERRPTVDAWETVELLQADAPAEEVCGCSMRLLDELPGASKSLLQAVLFEEEPLRDAAADAGLTANAASVRLHRVRQGLRSRMKEVCGTTSVAACQDCGCPPSAH